jgi:hypothetical protein
MFMLTAVIETLAADTEKNGEDSSHVFVTLFLTRQN